MKHQSEQYFPCITFSQMPLDVEGFWSILVEFLEAHKALPKMFQMSQIAGHSESLQSEDWLRVKATEVAEVIKNRGLTAFNVNTGYTKTSVALKLGQFHFTSWIAEKAQAPSDWCDFIEIIVARFETIGGWIPLNRYRTWQNSRGPDDYARGTLGPLPTGYKTRYEPPKYGIGPGQTLFEETINPGRVKLVDHRCIFYPTAEMWLGPHFWPYAKCTKDEALAADFWMETRDTPHYTYFKCWPTAFTRPDGEQGRMQQRLWKLFFREDCEWPPGSGAICDEPMYGPKELWPEGLDYPYDLAKDGTSDCAS